MSKELHLSSKDIINTVAGHIEQERHDEIKDNNSDVHYVLYAPSTSF